MTTQLYVRHIPFIGYWNRDDLCLTTSLSQATRYTEEEVNILGDQYMFPNERWMLVSE